MSTIGYYVFTYNIVITGYKEIYEAVKNRHQTIRRQRENISMLPYFLTYSILLSPTSQRLAVHPLSPERETCCLLFISEAMAFLLSLSVSSSVMLSFVPPYCNQLSPLFDGPPFLSRKELRFAS